MRKWHEILGHCNVKDVLKLENVAEGMKISEKEFGDCSVCIQGKMVNETCKLPDARAKIPTSTLSLCYLNTLSYFIGKL